MVPLIVATKLLSMTLSEMMVLQKYIDSGFWSLLKYHINWLITVPML
jgi:hypothetical protein